MATLGKTAFERTQREASATAAGYAPPMINTVLGRREWLTLFALAIIWGAAFFFIATAVREVPPLTYVWLRLSIAAVALWGWLWLTSGRPSIPREAVGALFVLALLNNVAPFILFGWGQTHIASGLASILNATTPLWGVIVAHFYTRDEPMTAGKLAGILIGVGGVAVMIGPELLGNIGTDALAQLACVLASLSYALAGVWARRFKRMGVAPANVASWQLLLGALVMLPLTAVVDRPWLLPSPSWGAIGAIVALAVVCTAYGYILYFRLIDRAGATNALLSTLLVPPFAIVLGALFLDEQLALRDFAGMALIALGLAAIDGRPLKWLVRRQLPEAA
ncbi:MAG: DMT family transporter [Pseudomonadota bacterium]|nr:DMT family transporter [Pseudomonadota bacterium]